jgi:hypothetical protein
MMPPAWLSDDVVRNDIHFQLEVDRCMEEEARLMQERAVIQEWMLVEWEAVQGALNNAGVCGYILLSIVVSDFAVTDAVMSFHLQSRANELVNICVVRKKKVQCIPCAWPVVESWGPSDEALLQAACNQVQSSFRHEDDDESIEGEEEGDYKGDLEYGEIGDEELMDAIEDIALADEYRYDHSNEWVDDMDDIDDDGIPSSPIKLSHKCQRI